jgi:hypothetical protein
MPSLDLLDLKLTRREGEEGLLWNYGQSDWPPFELHTMSLAFDPLRDLSDHVGVSRETAEAHQGLYSIGIDTLRGNRSAVPSSGRRSL